MTDGPFPCASVTCLDDRILLKVTSDEGARTCLSGLSWGVAYARNPEAPAVEYPAGVNKPTPRPTSEGYSVYDKNRVYPEFLRDGYLVIMASSNKLWDGLYEAFQPYNDRMISNKDVEDLNWRCFKLTGLPDHVFWF